MHAFVSRKPWFFSLLLCPVILASFIVVPSGRTPRDQVPSTRHATLATPVDEADSLALVAFYNGTDGANWTNDTNWLVSPVALWFGVTVADGRVTRLELPDNSVRSVATSPDSTMLSILGDLTQLEVLDLQSNGLFFAVPDEITNLIHLEQLYLNDNHLSHLPDLRVLDAAAGTGALTTLQIENNLLTFEDIEPLVGASFATTYAPQREIQPGESAQVVEGDSLYLHVPVGGMHNQYQWFKDDVRIPGATEDRLRIGQLNRRNEGTYRLDITNTVATDLTLSAYIVLRFDPPFAVQWLDIGAYHHAYNESGAWDEPSAGMEYPAILRHSGHIRSKGFWIGVKDWTDPQGVHHPYYVARLGPRESGALYTYPTQHTLIGRYQDTAVEVNGEPSFDNEAVLDAIDPGLAADRMIHNIHNMSMGITVDRKIYAYTNEYHDNYHIIDYEYCNTGNVDDDEAIELPNQTLRDVVFYRINRWRGSEQGAWASTGAQVWGRYTVHDVVGDGHEEYPVDFTAQYAWIGWSIQSHERNYSDLGSPLFSDGPLFGSDSGVVAPGDSIGRLSGATMVGRSIIHADRSTTDASYDRDQPRYMAWLSNDDPLHNDVRGNHEANYELGILSPDLIDENTTCGDCTRTFPHMADRNQPDGEFWNPASSRRLALTGRIAGGYAPTTGYGPYDMGPGACINVTVSEGVDGLSFDAATKVGQAFKRAGSERDTYIIDYDANGDDAIDTTPFDYDNVFVGAESQTKDQWVMSARDSLYQTFLRARDLFAASNNMTIYPIAEPPRAPTRFRLWGLRERIDLEWTPATDGPAIDHWELYRTEDRVDNLYASGCLDDPSIPCGYKRVASLPRETTAYSDTDVQPDTDYYYYIVGVGEPQTVDENAITGTPGGEPLRSGRYLTQTYAPVALQASTGADDALVPGRFALEANYPNPFSSTTTIRYTLPTASEVELVVYDILGRQVEMLVQQFQGAGRHEQRFDAGRLASGVYVYVLRAGENQTERTMLVVN